MLRVNIPLGQFYNLCLDAAKRAGYYIAVCLISREADAPEIYDEVVRNWSSFHDLTGNNVIFLFAGDQLDDNINTEIRHKDSAGIRFFSDFLGVDSRRLVAVEPIPDDQVRAGTPYLKKPRQLRDEHTRQISELKRSLDLSEQDVPCLHFTFLHTGRQQTIHLKGLPNLSVYQLIKRFMELWEPTFRRIARLQWEISEAEKRRTDIEMRSVKQRPVLARDRETVASWTRDPSLDDASRAILEQMLNVVSQSEFSLENRRAYYAAIEKLRGHPDFRQDRISLLRRMIDLYYPVELRVGNHAEAPIRTADLIRQLEAQIRILEELFQQSSLGLLLQGKEASGMKHTNALVVFANPRNSSHLRLDNEDRVIRECIERSQHRENISTEIRHAVRIDDLARLLLEKEYRIVQFSGHGTGQGLVLEDELGLVQIVPKDALAELLATYSPPIECVILNACYSDVHSQDLSMGVPYTVVMNGPISDASATEFTRGFYDAIGSGKPIDFAYAEGCRRIKLKALTSGGIPALYTSTPRNV